MGVAAIAAFHDAKRRLYSDRDLDDIWLTTYHELYDLYASTFNDKIWPSLVKHTIDSILKIALWTATTREGTEEISCYSCWKKNPSWRHFLFDCEVCQNDVSKYVMDIAPTHIIDKYDARNEKLYDYVVKNMAGCPVKPPSHAWQVHMRLLWFAGLIHVWGAKLGWRGDMWENKKERAAYLYTCWNDFAREYKNNDRLSWRKSCADAVIQKGRVVLKARAK